MQDTDSIIANATRRYDDDGNEVIDMATCGLCGRSWNDAAISSLTPTPAGRCPWEYDHPLADDETAEGPLAAALVLALRERGAALAADRLGLMDPDEFWDYVGPVLDRIQAQLVPGSVPEPWEVAEAKRSRRNG